MIVPPTIVKPEEGIYLEFAPLRKNTLVPIYESQENSKFLQAIQPLMEYFGKKDSKVVEYRLNNSMFSNWKKPAKLLNINKNAIKEDISFYKAQGFEHITTFACFLSDDYIESYGVPPLKTYIDCFKELSITS